MALSVCASVPDASLLPLFGRARVRVGRVMERAALVLQGACPLARIFPAGQIIR